MNEAGLLLLESSAETEEARAKDERSAAVILAGKLDIEKRITPEMDTQTILRVVLEFLKSCVDSASMQVEKPKEGSL